MKLKLTGWVGDRVARLVAAWVAATFVLVGCGGDDNTAAASPPAAGTPAATVSGRVLDKKPVAGATVYLFLSGNPLGTATTDTEGYYSYTFEPNTKLAAGAPLDAVVLGREIPLVANNVVPADAANGLAGKVEIVSYVSPLTTLLSALASQSGRPYISPPAAATVSEATRLLPTAASSDSYSSVTPFTGDFIASLDRLVEVQPSELQPAGLDELHLFRQVMANLLERAADFGTPVHLTPTSPISRTEWERQHSYLDISVDVAWSATDSGLTISSWGRPESAQLLKGLVSPEPLEAPAVDSSYQDRLLAQIDHCLTSGGAACDIGSSVDSAYLHDGLSFTQRLASVPAGARAREVSTLRLLEAPELAVLGGHRGALVQLRIEGADGTPMVWNDVVRLTDDNQPVLVGNGVQYPIVVRSFLGRNEASVPGVGVTAFYENGLDFGIPSSVERDGASVQIGSAKIEGSGLPAGGLYLVTNSSGQLTLPVTPATAPWAECGSCARSDGLSTQYKWDRRTLDGTAVITTSYDYAPTTAATPFGVYLVSLYDRSGALMGTRQAVVNFGATVSASNGKTVAWPTLDPALVEQFLTPGGSLAGPQSAVTVKWQLSSGSQDRVYGSFLATVGAADSPAQAGFVQAYSADGAPVAFVRGRTDYGSLISRVNGVTREDIAAQTARQVRLSWAAARRLHTATWAYRQQ